jgi:UDP-2-acetamido-2,6-beta-L-arabino-hexul-4-ose reductase
MKTVLVTGAAGFLGRHMVESLRRREMIRVLEHDLGSSASEFEAALSQADAIVHLAGVNRPKDPAEFKMGNTDFTAEICRRVRATGRQPTIVLSSSVQAALDNPYGESKRGAESALETWAQEGGGRAIIFRLKNVFGKGCRPNYNSVTATFCYNIAHGLPISISEESKELELVYIDDVVVAMTVAALEPAAPTGSEYREVSVSYRVTLGELAGAIRRFKESRQTLVMPSFEGEFTRRLYATYLSYLEGADFAYSLEQRQDARGSLAEFVKSAHFGQIFVSRTNPGVTRGNHYHHTKTEKFLVVEGEAIVRFRPIWGGAEIAHRVNGRDFRVVDIPPGYAHSIENVGVGELVTIFWASEIFDPTRPDTVAAPVLLKG